jgi:hypothetical protein
MVLSYFVAVHFIVIIVFARSRVLRRGARGGERQSGRRESGKAETGKIRPHPGLLLRLRWRYGATSQEKENGFRYPLWPAGFYLRASAVERHRSGQGLRLLQIC